MYPGKSDYNASVMFPDTLVRQTFTSVTDTIHNVSAFSTFSCGKESTSGLMDNDNDSFEAFFDKTL